MSVIFNSREKILEFLVNFLDVFNYGKFDHLSEKDNASFYSAAHTIYKVKVSFAVPSAKLFKSMLCPHFTSVRLFTADLE